MASGSEIEDDSRHYPNPFPDFSPENSTGIIDLAENDLDKTFKNELKNKIEVFMLRLEGNIREWNRQKDPSIYSGNGGIAYLYYFLGKTLDKPAFSAWARELLEKSPADPNYIERTYSFLTGNAGRLVLSALLRNTRGDEENRMLILSKLFKMWHHTINQGSDELLYGRVGYVYAVLVVKRNISSSVFKDEYVKRLVDHIITEGKNYSEQEKSKSPLMYNWRYKEYLGGAHGLAGILYILLQAREYLTEDQLSNYIEPSIQYLISVRFPSGNFPSSVGNETDRLVHWCHGAPSMTMLFILAHEIFKKDEYLEIAKKCGEVVWRRGLLKKGCGLCHGVAGNAYTFLALFKHTKEPIHLYRACKFAEWCFDYESRQNRIPDHPYSLFEGLAGIIYFLADLMNPLTAKFPGYDV